MRNRGCTAGLRYVLFHAMSWNRLSRVVWEFFALSIGAWAQGTRPEAGPFDAAHIEIQPPPAPGVAVRAGRLFDRSRRRIW